MGAIASIEDLTAAQKDIVKAMKGNAGDLLAAIDKHKLVGYKNLIKLANGKTPEELKG